MSGKQAKTIHAKCLYQYLTHKHNSYSKVFVSVITSSPTGIVIYKALTCKQSTKHVCKGIFWKQTRALWSVPVWCGLTRLKGGQ